MRLKSLEQRKIDNLCNAIKSILWADFWPEYKAKHNVGGLEASNEAWNGEFMTEWNKTSYAKAKSYEEVVKALAEDGYTPDDILSQVQEINDKKAATRQKFEQIQSKPYSNEDYNYEQPEY